jgi:phosphatidylserine/phosphatidylglycerophosphate/cardiolipin synthase-like enzyme
MIFFLLLSNNIFVANALSTLVTECVQLAREALIKEKGIINSVLFVPDHKVKNVLLGLIHSEQKSIKTALFRLSDREVSTALSQAHERGVVIEIIADKGGLWDKNEKLSTLEAYGIPICYFKRPYACMHNKIWIFGKNLDQKSLVWSGSANATFSGLTRNEENVYVTDNLDFIAQYEEKFTALWRQLSSDDGFKENKTEQDDTEPTYDYYDA